MFLSTPYPLYQASGKKDVELNLKQCIRIIHLHEVSKIEVPGVIPQDGLVKAAAEFLSAAENTRFGLLVEAGGSVYGLGIEMLAVVEASSSMVFQAWTY